jgi:diguanylate cyclase (GGDEF)-like protein
MTKGVTLPDGMTQLERSLNQKRPSHEVQRRVARAPNKYNVLLRIIKVANDTLDPSKVLQLIMDNVQKLIPCEAWSILLLKEGQNVLKFERARGAGASGLMYSTLKVGEGIAGWVAKNRKAVIVNDAECDPRFNSKFDRAINFRTKSILCVPLISRNRLLGVVELINKKGRTYRFSKRDLQTASTLLGPIAVSLHNALLFKEGQKLAITDDLTKLYNNRFVNNFLTDWTNKPSTSVRNASLIFLDLDGFKTVNDRYGHLVGGRTLVEVGQIIFSNVRKKDVVARYGGDEFIVILPDTGSEEALVIAEKIRLAIRNYDFMKALAKEIHLSASFGISVFPLHGRTVTELIQKADNAMYTVKYSGKDAVQLAQ